MKYAILIMMVCFISCNTTKQASIATWSRYDEKEELAANAKNESTRLRYKLIQSKILDKNDLWKSIAPQLKNFTEADYTQLEPLIFNQNIPTIQINISEGKLT